MFWRLRLFLFKLRWVLLSWVGVGVPRVFCGLCDQFLSRRAWAFHRHNSERVRPSQLAFRIAFFPVEILVRVSRRALVPVVGVAILIYIATSAFHLSNGFSLSESLGMSVEDGRMLVTCPTNPEGIWDFVKRDQVDALDVDLAQEQGIGVYEKACVGELFARTRTLKPESTDGQGWTA